MKKLTIYLSGPIQNVKERSEAANWRNEIKERYAEDFDFIDPMDNEWNTDQKSIYTHSKAVVHVDKKLILDSDILFAHIPFPSVGTSMDIMWAHMHHKMVIVWCPLVAPLSAWIVEHANYIESNQYSAMQHALSACAYPKLNRPYSNTIPNIE